LPPSSLSSDRSWTSRPYAKPPLSFSGGTTLNATAFAHFDALAETRQGGLDSVIAEHALPFHVTTMAVRGSVTYRKERVRNYRDYLEIDKSFAYLSWLYQCNRGVLIVPGAEENWTLSVQHSVEDVRRFVDNFAEKARDLPIPNG
jgi:glutamate-1-semialdehyde 2,1-aminomutase